MTLLKLYYGAAFLFVAILLGLVIWQTIRELRGVSRAALEEKLAQLDAEQKKRPVRSDERVAEREQTARSARRERSAQPVKQVEPAPAFREDDALVLAAEEREYEDIGMATRGVVRLDVLGR